jgi:hypothetical protein
LGVSGRDVRMQGDGQTQRGVGYGRGTRESEVLGGAL